MKSTLSRALLNSLVAVALLAPSAASASGPWHNAYYYGNQQQYWCGSYYSNVPCTNYTNSAYNYSYTYPTYSYQYSYPQQYSYSYYQPYSYYDYSYTQPNTYSYTYPAYSGYTYYNDYYQNGYQYSYPTYSNTWNAPPCYPSTCYYMNGNYFQYR